MDTIQFLSHVLPDEGLYCLAEFFPNGAVKHHFYQDLGVAAKAVPAIDSKNTVYHACASYKTNENRKQANVDKVKSFFLDLDVGENKDYPNLAAAKEAIKHLCSELKLHVPTIISSGKGLHAYFVFDAAVSGDVWKSGATLFRQVLDAIGFKHDPSRTTDQASILRPVGSTWKKNGERPVKAVYVSSPQPFSWYIDRFNDYARTHSLTPPASTLPKNPYAGLFEVEKLGTKTEYPPSSVITVASLCAQLGRMRDLKGAVSEPEWRNAIGVIKHCQEGQEIAHEWSQGDPRYDHDQTQEKLDRWETGPTTCDQFERTNSHICASCKYKGKIKSPIQLGYVEKIQAPEELKQPEGVEQKSIDLKHYWPDGFRWDKDSRTFMHLQKSKDEAPEWVVFCESFFYPTTRVQMSDGTWAQRITMEVNPGKYREFDLPTKTLASQDALTTALAAHEIVIKPRRGHIAVTYLEGFRNKLQRASVELKLHKRLGWYSDVEDFDSFVIGTDVIRKNGKDGKISLDEEIKFNRDIYTGNLWRGSDLEWARLLNLAYNREGAQPYQFAIMAALSSPIVGLLGVDQWHGIPVGLTGPSGQGKTTVAKAALMAYGPVKMCMFEARNATDKSPDAFLGVNHNLPVVLDEYTGKDPGIVANHLYAMSTGSGRTRLNQKGNISEVTHTWDMIQVITGNSNINETMNLLAKSEGTAGQVRVFEYMFQGHETSTIFKDDDIQNIIEHQMSQHYGVAGRNALRYMMNHVSEIKEDFERLRKKYGFEAHGYDSKERYFVDLIATTEIGGKIFAKLGYIQWDVDKVISWARDHMVNLRNLRTSQVSSVDDKIALFLGTLVGHTLVTKTYGRTNELPMESFPIRGEVKARMAITDKKFYVSAAAFNTWCTAYGIQPSYLRTELFNDKFITSTEDTRMTLTKGTNIPSTNQRVVEFYFDKISGAVKAEDSKVVSIAQ